MINVSTLATPNVLLDFDYEDLLQEHIAEVQELLPDWKPSEGDLMLIEKQASAYREMHLRAEFNSLSKAFFLSTTTDSNLENYAVFYGIKRLQGAKPTANYKFYLTATLTYQVILPAGSVLMDDGGQYRAVLLEDVVFVSGVTNATGLIELQMYEKQNEVKTTLLQTPLPYIGNIEALEVFQNGDSIESDEDLRKRILLSLADKSTAGSEMSYKSYAHGADSRVEDVSVFSEECGVVNVVIYAPTDVENTASDRVYSALTASEIRPLTDKVVVSYAKAITYEVDATLKIFEGNDSASVYTQAMQSLTTGVNGLLKIGADITKSEINDFLRVAGVKEVVLRSPVERIAVDRDSIAICTAKKVNYEVYNEQY